MLYSLHSYHKITKNTETKTEFSMLLQLQDTLHTSISSSRTLDDYSSLRNISISLALPLAMKVKDLLKLWRKLSVSFSSRLCVHAKSMNGFRH